MKYIKLLPSKALILIFCIGMFANTVFGQSFRFGLQTAGNMGWMKASSKGYANKGIKLGYSYGILCDFALADSENYWLSTGLSVASHAGNLEYKALRTIEGEYVKAEARNSYRFSHVELPFLLKMKTNEIGYLTYFGQFGLGTGVNIKSSLDEEFSYSGKTEQLDDREFADEQTRLFRLARIVGLGVEYNLSGNTNLMVGATFNNGFTNLFNKNAVVYEYSETDEIDTKLVDDEGNPKPGSAHLKAISNYVALHVGVFF